MRGRLALWRLWYFFCITITTILFIKFTKTVFSQNCHIVLSYYGEDDISIFCITITTKVLHWSNSKVISAKKNSAVSWEMKLYQALLLIGRKWAQSSLFCKIFIVILMSFKGGWFMSLGWPARKKWMRPWLGESSASFDTFWYTFWLGVSLFGWYDNWCKYHVIIHQELCEIFPKTAPTTCGVSRLQGCGCPGQYPLQGGGVQWVSWGVHHYGHGGDENHQKLKNNNNNNNNNNKVLFLSLIVMGGEGGIPEILCHKIEEALLQMKR